jgi:hypothetical protein
VDAVAPSPVSSPVAANSCIFSPPVSIRLGGRYRATSRGTNHTVPSPRQVRCISLTALPRRGAATGTGAGGASGAAAAET